MKRINIYFLLILNLFKKITLTFLLFISFQAIAQEDSYTLIKAKTIFDGVQFHTNKVVLIKGNKITNIDNLCL